MCFGNAVALLKKDIKMYCFAVKVFLSFHITSVKHNFLFCNTESETDSNHV